jgi:hypothetical protein
MNTVIKRCEILVRVGICFEFKQRIRHRISQVIEFVQAVSVRNQARLLGCQPK